MSRCGVDGSYGNSSFNSLRHFHSVLTVAAPAFTPCEAIILKNDSRTSLSIQISAILYSAHLRNLLDLDCKDIKPLDCEEIKPVNLKGNQS